MRASAALLVALTVLAQAARAQPADCIANPEPSATIPLWLDLEGLPGVPKGLHGSVGADIPAPPPGGTVCAPGAPPPPDGDVLAGPPGNVLRGQPAQDLLRGNVPRVEIQQQ